MFGVFGMATIFRYWHGDPEGGRLVRGLALHLLNIQQCPMSARQGPSTTHYTVGSTTADVYPLLLLVGSTASNPYKFLVKPTARRFQTNITRAYPGQILYA